MEGIYTVETQKKKNLYYKPRIHLQTCGGGLTFSQKKLKDKGSVRLMLRHKAGGGKVSYFSVVEICVEWVHWGTMDHRIRKLEIASVGRTERALCLWSKGQPMHRALQVIRWYLGWLAGHCSSTTIITYSLPQCLTITAQYHPVPGDTRRYQEFPGVRRRSQSQEIPGDDRRSCIIIMSRG